jgi:hypothetical protein
MTAVRREIRAPAKAAVVIAAQWSNLFGSLSSDLLGFAEFSRPVTLPIRTPTSCR